jgi:hypothetical protein
MPIERPDWNLPAVVTTSDAPPATHDEPDGGAQADAAAEEQDALADLDADDVATYRKLLSDGVFSPEELARHYGLSTEEVDGLSKSKPPSRQSIDEEIAAIEQRIRADRRGWFKDEAAQARHRDLLALREKLKASPAPAKSKPDNGGDGSRASIDAELAAIQKTMREDRRAYDKDPEMQARRPT